MASRIENPSANATADKLNGFDLYTPDANGTISFDTGSRTFSIAVKAGESSFSFWSSGVKYTKTTTQTTTIANTTGTYYIYFDASGELQNIAYDGENLDLFYTYALVGLVYWNATTSNGLVGDERHGYRMSGSTHYAMHTTHGALYASGFDVTGLANGSETYTQVAAGVFFDEDIQHSLLVQSTHRFLYRLGATGEWTYTDASNQVGYKEGGDTYYSWNEYTGGAWQLSEGGVATDYFMTFFMATPNTGDNTVFKVVGQNAYSSKNNARDAIRSEIRNLITAGLPGPEFIFLFAVIVKRNGELQVLDDGSLYIDFRPVKGYSTS